MSRGLGAPLALSALAHGGAVAAVAVLGMAWLVGSPPARAPAALYVDLVDPVVATSDRHEPAGAPAARVRVARSRRPAAAPLSPLPDDMAWSVDTPAAEATAPVVEPEGPASDPSEVPRPPPAPVVPGATVARTDSTLAAERVRRRPSAAPQTSAPMPSTVASPSASPSPADAVARSLASDPGPTSPRSIVAGVAVVPPSGLADDWLSTPMPGSAAQRPLRGSGPGELAGPVEREQPGQIAGAAPHSGGQPAADGGVRLARVPSGEAQGRSAPDGAVPPEYESYVRSLRRRIQERLAYPWTAVRRGQQGVVELEVRVGADGRLVAVEVVAGSNAETLRVAAVAAVRGSAPFPFPPGLAARPLVIRLPVEFRLR